MFGFGAKKKELQILIHARELISTPDHWCKGRFAVDSQGKAVTETSERAYAWCLTGALYRSAHDLGYFFATENAFFRSCARLIRLSSSLSYNAYSGVMSYNDNVLTTHQDILDLLDTGIREIQFIPVWHKMLDWLSSKKDNRHVNS
jgi:hypothetical protein